MTTLPSYAVTFRGFPACPCLATWLPAYEAELQRRGVLDGPLHIYQLIGGAAASADTHSQGGAFDLLDLPGGEDLVVARQMGADATWSRPDNWDGRGGMPHIHGVLTGCPHNGPAHYQIDAVRDGYNGLGHLGRGGRDTGPRPLSGRTWREGIAWATRQREKEDDLMAFSEWSDADKKAFGEFIQDQVRLTLIPDVPQQDGTRKAQHLGSLLKGMTQNIIDIEREARR